MSKVMRFLSCLVVLAVSLGMNGFAVFAGEGDDPLAPYLKYLEGLDQEHVDNFKKGAYNGQGLRFVRKDFNGRGRYSVSLDLNDMNIINLSAKDEQLDAVKFTPQQGFSTLALAGVDSAGWVRYRTTMLNGRSYGEDYVFSDHGIGGKGDLKFNVSIKSNSGGNNLIDVTETDKINAIECAMEGWVGVVGVDETLTAGDIDYLVTNGYLKVGGSYGFSGQYVITNKGVKELKTGGSFKPVNGGDNPINKYDIAILNNAYNTNKKQVKYTVGDNKGKDKGAMIALLDGQGWVCDSWNQSGGIAVMTNLFVLLSEATCIEEMYDIIVKYCGTDIEGLTAALRKAASDGTLTVEEFMNCMQEYGAGVLALGREWLSDGTKLKQYLVVGNKFAVEKDGILKGGAENIARYERLGIIKPFWDTTGTALAVTAEDFEASIWAFCMNLASHVDRAKLSADTKRAVTINLGLGDSMWDIFATGKTTTIVDLTKLGIDNGIDEHIYNYFYAALFGIGKTPASSESSTTTPATQGQDSTSTSNAPSPVDTNGGTANIPGITDSSDMAIAEPKPWVALESSTETGRILGKFSENDKLDLTKAVNAAVVSVNNEKSVEYTDSKGEKKTVNLSSENSKYELIFTVPTGTADTTETITFTFNRPTASKDINISVSSTTAGKNMEDFSNAFSIEAETYGNSILSKNDVNLTNFMTGGDVTGYQIESPNELTTKPLFVTSGEIKDVYEDGYVEQVSQHLGNGGYSKVIDYITLTENNSSLITKAWGSDYQTAVTSIPRGAGWANGKPAGTSGEGETSSEVTASSETSGEGVSPFDQGGLMDKLDHLQNHLQNKLFGF